MNFAYITYDLKLI